jgi:hypothetical protein
MATRVYKTKKIELLDGTEIILSPLKIKYLHEFMERFEDIKDVKDDDEAIDILVDCVRICMKQFYPLISKSVDDVENFLNLPKIYEVLDIAAGIKMGKKEEDSVKSSAVSEGQNWKDLDLVALESEIFLTGKWKDFDELESSLCMPELTALLESKRELDYQEKKFFAAMEGVDLDEQSGKGQKEWEDMKARVFSKGTTGDSNDVLALQGINAKKAGFGIGMGLEYEDLTK